MNYRNPSLPLDHSASYSASSPREGLGGQTILLALLISSYFYVLPLGRYSVAGFSSDYRIYDFVFVFFMLAVGFKKLPRLGELRSDRYQYHFWGIFLIVLVWFSLIFTALFGGFNSLLPALIRAFRFTAYFIIPSLIVTVVDTPVRQRFLVWVFYLNVLVQAGLAFAQELGRLPTFWPSYWHFYGDPAPVGTLSLNHLQISVVMLLGLALSATFLRTARSPFQALLAGVGAAVMLAVIFFSGSRSAWFAIPVMALAYIYAHRLRGIGTFLGLIVLVAGSLWALQSWVADPIQQQIETRLMFEIEYGGISAPLDDRLTIYEDFDTRLRRRPWVLLTGSGFQNISYFLPNPGAHNNYLQAWLELGLLGFIVYLGFLTTILRTLRATAINTHSAFEKVLASDVWVAFVGVMVTMLAAETLWAQYSSFTLSGQILALVGLATCPLYWAKNETKPSDQPADSQTPRPYWRNF
jgi:O-antigen ligase